MPHTISDELPATDEVRAEPNAALGRIRLTRFRRPHVATAMVLTCGLLITAGLSIASRLNYLHSERRQVTIQVKLAASSLAVAPVDVQRRIGRGALLAAASGNAALFGQELGPSVPSPFDGARLVDMSSGTPKVLETLGKPLQLAVDSPESVAMLTKAVRLRSLTVVRIATPTAQRFGYAFSAQVSGRTYVSYAEQLLPPDRRVSLPPDSPLRELNFAIYDSKTETPATLVETNTDHLPLHGSIADAPIPFGDQVLWAVASPRTPLLGTFAASISWLILGAGIVLTCVLALLIERLVRRRAMAEQLATVTGKLYQAQRGVAETLQTSLLPQSLPEHPQLEVATRYIAGTEGINVGGDWYDVVDVGTGVFFTIGDVSGRGLSAASMMSRLRHSITAYAREGHGPATVLAKVSDLIDLERDQHFATVICGSLDLDTGLVTVANAGHPPLLLITEERTTKVAAPVGPPLGVGHEYEPVELRLLPGAVLLAYTDGLVERRGDPLESGIAELRRVARPMADLDDLLDLVLLAVAPRAASDDTAILGLRWNF